MGFTEAESDTLHDLYSKLDVIANDPAQFDDREAIRMAYGIVSQMMLVCQPMRASSERLDLANTCVRLNMLLREAYLGEVPWTRNDLSDVVKEFDDDIAAATEEWLR